MWKRKWTFQCLLQYFSIVIGVWLLNVVVKENLKILLSDALIAHLVFNPRISYVFMKLPVL